MSVWYNDLSSGNTNTNVGLKPLFFKTNAPSKIVNVINTLFSLLHLDNSSLSIL